VRYQLALDVSSPLQSLTQYVDVVCKPFAGASAPSVAEFQKLDGAVAGNLNARRSFTPTGIPASFTSAVCGADITLGIDYTMWSCKPSIAAFNSGSLDAAWKTFLGTWPKGHRGMVTLWHEPEDNVGGGEFTKADWQAMIVRAGNILHSMTRPEIKMGIILMGALSFENNPSGRGWGELGDWWGQGFDSAVDVIGFDQYRSSSNQGPLGTLLTTNPTGATTNPVAWARGHHKPIVIPEWGCTDDVGPTEKAKWIKEGAAWLDAQNDVPAWCYFHNNNLAGNAAFTYAIKYGGPEMAAFSAAVGNAV
jgi:hypothetical protein